MNGFDVAVVAVVALSTLFAFARGVVRELIALATWVAAFVLAIGYAEPVARAFAWLDVTPMAKHVLAFALILIAVVLFGALVSRLLSGAVRAVGLGFVDRLLGAAFGLARGLLIVVVFALVAGVTALPARDWWQNSTFGRSLGIAALALKPWLPLAWAERLDFSAARATSAHPGVRSTGMVLGEHSSCAES